MIKTAAHKQVSDNLLMKISEATSGLSGHDFILELTKKIPSLLGMRYCLVSECSNDEKTRVRTVSYVDKNKILENIEYDLEGTPCEIVMQGKEYSCLDELEKIFPK